MNSTQGRPQLLVRHAEQPFRAVCFALRNMQPQGLDQHHVGEVLAGTPTHLVDDRDD